MLNAEDPTTNERAIAHRLTAIGALDDIPLAERAATRAIVHALLAIEARIEEQTINLPG